ncbi:CaiB/BaiF CoA transferase family protein [Ostreibacterium oceani]|uniref:CoA transferase n=1 Tax=Ostreibacterium oceani TaxID=2654998 RepID=A0A6N7EY31_9GAMM|nr:CaiB/BaiF CoA-transferase family protein [Ostreibacterium oceani]MPV86485.1 CoA transferase [Ostreibacterium oceani]
MQSPLKNIRVLDLTNVLAGPFCGQQLAHLGAEVIKIETPGIGDLARKLGADEALNAVNMGASFLAQNIGKQSLTINLKTPDGKTLFKELVSSADVVVENFRPGVMERLDLSYDTLSQINPSIIYCAISGFGQDGPMHELPAYDQIIQGLSGIMDITGDEDSGPYRVGYPIADTVGGMTAAFAIAACLAGRAMHHHPNNKHAVEKTGSYIDVSMLDSTLATMGWVVSNFLTTGQPPKRMGNNNFTNSPSGTFKTGDGLLNIAANKQAQFEAVCHVIGRPELIQQPEFADRYQRIQHRETLTTAIESALAEKSATEWQQALNKVGVPAGCVLSLPQTLALEQIQHREFIRTFAPVEPTGRTLQLAGTGYRIDRQTTGANQPPPQLGQHNMTILQSLGYTPQQIEALTAQGVL